MSHDADVPRRYRRRLQVIEAIRYNGANEAAIAAWIGIEATTEQEYRGPLIIRWRGGWVAVREGNYVMRLRYPDRPVAYASIDAAAFEYAYEPTNRTH